MGIFEFRILGPLEVSHGDESVPVRGIRERTVLATLLLEAGRVVPVARLVQAIWDCDPPPAAEKAVRNTVSALRGRFAQPGCPGSLISTSPAGYRLDLAGNLLDAAEFSNRAASARGLASTGRTGEAVAEYRAALSLWRGAALADLGGIVIEPGAARLEEQRLAIVEDCLELELKLGRHRELVGELRALTAEWPLRERLAGLLMLALYRSGRQAEALDAHRRLAKRLANDLGMDPSAEVNRLHEAILRQDPALTAASMPTGSLCAPSPGGDREQHEGGGESVGAKAGEVPVSIGPAAVAETPAPAGQAAGGTQAAAARESPSAPWRGWPRAPRRAVLEWTIGALAVAAIAAALTIANDPTKSPVPVAASRPGMTSERPVAPVSEHRSGPLVLVPGEVADLDSMAPGWGVVKAPGAASDDVWFSISDHGLHGNRNADIAVLPPGSIGTFSECALEQDYGVTLTPPRIRPGQLVCNITNQNRVALLRIIDVQYTSDGTPDQVTFDVIVWVPPHKT
jgi:DNA-binding SARP family transcriptional activator